MVCMLRKLVLGRKSALVRKSFVCMFGKSVHGRRLDFLHFGNDLRELDFLGHPCG